MDSQPWLEGLRHELRQQQLPASYIDRLVEELGNHAADAQLENTSMEAQQAFDRLGSTEQLAAVARREFKQRTLAGRHPVLIFLVGPIALVPLIWVLSVVGLSALLSLIGTAIEFVTGDVLKNSTTVDPIEYYIVRCLNLLSLFTPFAIAACLYCHWGKRSGMRRWGMTSCCIVAIIAGLLVTKVTPATADSPGLWILGLGLRPNLSQLLQALVPLLLGMWLLAGLPKHNVTYLRASDAQS